MKRSLIRGAKSLAAFAMHYSGARFALAEAARRRAGGHRTLILSYHRVVEDFDRERRQAIAGLLVSGQTLRRQIDDLWASGYEPTSLDDALEMLSGARKPRRDVVVFTFDDGYREVYDLAFPVLERLGIPGVVYLPTGYVDGDRALPHDRLFSLLSALAGAPGGGRNQVSNRVRGGEAPGAVQSVEARVDALLKSCHPRDVEGLLMQLERAVPIPPVKAPLLTWDMCRAMSKRGFTLGAHTRSHSSLHLLGEAELAEEVAGSKRDVEQAIGQPCKHFAYPNGYYTAAVLRAVVDAGFESAVTTEDVGNRVGDDPFRLKRKTLWENHSQGVLGYSPALTACQVDNVFGMLGLVAAVPGHQAEVAASFAPVAARA